VPTSQASRNYVVGPSLEFYLPHHVSVEADAFYAPLSFVQIPLPGLAGLLLLPSLATVNSWQFPVVGKYKFGEKRLTPYIETGPTFRETSSHLNRYLSNSGVTAGLGVDTTFWKLHIAPEVRYIHWSKDAPDAGLLYASRRNQAELLVGLSY
jgi:hypothetical protein